MIKRFLFLCSIFISCAAFTTIVAMEFVEQSAATNARLQIINADDPEANEQFVRSLRDVGFALIRNPDPSISIAALEAEWTLFFSQSKEEKMADHSSKSPSGLGFYPRGVERAEGATEQNDMEYYHYAPGHTLPAGLSEQTETYFFAMQEIKVRLIQWID